MTPTNMIKRRLRLDGFLYFLDELAPDDWAHTALMCADYVQRYLGLNGGRSEYPVFLTLTLSREHFAGATALELRPMSARTVGSTPIGKRYSGYVFDNFRRLCLECVDDKTDRLGNAHLYFRIEEGAS
jgi:hypothetical protein